MNYGDLSKEELIAELERKDNFIKEIIFKNNGPTLEAVLEATADGILVLDNESNIVHYNKRFQELWEIPENILCRRHSIDLAKYVKHQLCDSEEFIPTIEKITLGQVEYTDRLYFKDNRVFERYFQPLIIDGVLKGMVWSFRDITLRVDLENELIESRKLYTKLIERLPEGVIVYKDDKVFLINDTAEKLLKLKKDDALGKPIDYMVRPYADFREKTDARFEYLNKNEASLDFYEKRLYLNDGSEIIAEISSFSFKNEDQLFITSIFRDITEKKEIAKLEKTILEKNKLLKAEKEYSKLKTQLFSTVSHELKTPLNIIFSSVQLLEKLYSTEPLNKYLKVMRQNCYRLLRLINNLIDLNRIEVGFYKLDFKNHDVVKIIEDISLSVVEYTDSKGIELIFDTNVEEKLMACDAEKLERIMLNLLSNAIKFTEPGGTIEINIIDKSDLVEIHVRDTGIGIPKDMAKKIFETFRQVDSSLRRKVEGSGIGLSLVKSLVELHNGRIHVDSKLGEGSEFIIELPVRLLEETPVVEEEMLSIDHRIEKVSIEFSDIYD